MRTIHALILAAAASIALTLAADPIEVAVAGGTLYGDECGSGPAIVLLHDGLLHSVVWDDMWPLLCAKHHVVRYDRRGYGRSAAAKARFSPIEDLRGVMRDRKIEHAVLIGSSSGSALAVDFAIAYPKMADALFLIGPVVHGMRSSDSFNQRGNAANAPLANGDTQAAAKNWAEDPFQIAGDRPEARKKIFDTLVANPQNFNGSGKLEIRPSPPTVTRLQEVQAPTLLIVGEHDIADVHAFAGALQAGVPVVRREIWNGDGHLIQLEKPADLVSRLEAFIAVVQKKIVTVPRSVLRAHAGEYRFGDSTARIAVANGRIVLRISGEADIPLFPESRTRFLVRTTGTEVQFERDSSGRTTTMFISQPNGAQPLRCPRI